MKDLVPCIKVTGKYTYDKFRELEKELEDKIAFIINYRYDSEGVGNYNSYLSKHRFDRIKELRKELKTLRVEQQQQEVTYYPIHLHKHNDIENGQREYHYHVDTRYWTEYDVGIRFPLPLEENQKLVYRYMERKRTHEKFPTPIRMIKKSKLKHKCIHKGKCPHRGYDLTNVEPDENGVITCPLHSLKFDAKTKKLIN